LIYLFKRANLLITVIRAWVEIHDYNVKTYTEPADMGWMEGSWLTYVPLMQGAAERNNLKKWLLSLQLKVNLEREKRFHYKRKLNCGTAVEI
jgi:hypothetical protein